jgi:hypothetical protein
MESSRKCISIVFLEALHIFAVSHHIYSFHNLSFVIPDKFQGKEEEMFEM